MGEPTYYYGARVELAPGAQVRVHGGYVRCSPNLDAAQWDAELAEGEQAPRIYRVRPTGALENEAELADYAGPPHPTMTWRTRAPLVVIEEVTAFDHYHGTRAQLKPGDMIAPGHAANFGPTPRTANFVYFTRTLDASIWGAELSAGEGPGRIYVVEPTGPIEDDPNLTNAKFRGNPTKSFRSRAPLRVLRELTGWKGHAPEVIAAMKEGIARLEKAGVGPEDA